jgi:hypothetical protein
VRNKPVKKVAQIITVPRCNTGLGMIFVKPRGTKILTEGDSWFYIQPNVGQWVASSECASMAPSECMLTVT